MAEKNTETPIEYPGGHRTLAAALAAFQADLPSVHKGATGQVGQNRNYKYADLSDLNGAVLPKLGAVGLSFSAKPTVNDAGKFVLAYVLRHVGGDSDGGEWPLPDSGNPQQIGSALTYARRYALQAVTGVAPDEDDDGQSAAPQSFSRQRPAQPREQPPDEQVTKTPVDIARAELVALAEKNEWDIVDVRKAFAAQYKYPLRDASDPGPVRAFTKLLPGLMAPATAGAAQ